MDELNKIIEALVKVKEDGYYGLSIDEIAEGLPEALEDFSNKKHRVYEKNLLIENVFKNINNYYAEKTEEYAMHIRIVKEISKYCITHLIDDGFNVNIIPAFTGIYDDIKANKAYDICAPGIELPTLRETNNLNRSIYEFIIDDAPKSKCVINVFMPIYYDCFDKKWKSSFNWLVLE